MDSRFGFLGAAQAALLSEVLNRRDRGLVERLSRSSSISRADAEAVMSAISEELTNNLDADWEPTDYGRTLSALLGNFNAARISEWP